MAYERMEAETLKRLASFRAAGELERRYHNLGIGAVAAAAAHLGQSAKRVGMSEQTDPARRQSAALPIT